VPIAAADPVWGGRRALVSIVVFGDFQCPYTGRVLPTLRALEAKYGPEDLRVVWKDEPLPFHGEARSTAEAANAVFALGGREAFWRFWEAALLHQGELSAASFEAWAVAAGVAQASYRRAAEQHVGRSKVEADLALAERLGVAGTPTSFVNGIELAGAQPVEKFVAVVDAELAKAKARLASGTAPDALYTTLAEANWKPPSQEAEDEPSADDKKVWNLPLAGAPARGGQSPLVTIVEFSDFQCPFCKRVAPTMKELLARYGDKLRVVWRDEPLPFHPHALPAAELAREARTEKGDAGFWAAHDALFDAQPSLADEELVALGRGLGLDSARVKSALADKRYATAIQADLDLAEDAHAEGTPHFFINGRRLVGAQPVEAFAAVIDEEIRRAEALIAAGTPRTAVYEALMKTAEKPSPGEVRQVVARSSAPFKGPAAARVVIEEFADFQCPFCARAEETLRTVTKTYGPSVKIVWRNLPFHTHSDAAAEAAAEAQHQKGNAGFWAMHDKLLEHQGDHDGDGSGLARAALDGYARDLGLDVTAFDKALDARAHAEDIDADSRAADAARIQGTPAFVIGGYYLAGAQPFERFRRVIDHVLAHGPATPSSP